MGQNEIEIVGTPSILDRLVDLEPDSKKEAQPSSWEVERQFKEALCRDLGAILNTRRAEEDFDPAYEEATNSLLTFGVIDFTSYNLKDELEQDRLRRDIGRAISHVRTAPNPGDGIRRGTRSAKASPAVSSISDTPC